MSVSTASSSSSPSSNGGVTVPATSDVVPDSPPLTNGVAEIELVTTSSNPITTTTATFPQKHVHKEADENGVLGSISGSTRETTPDTQQQQQQQELMNENNKVVVDAGGKRDHVTQQTPIGNNKTRDLEGHVLEEPGQAADELRKMTAVEKEKDSSGDGGGNAATFSNNGVGHTENTITPPTMSARRRLLEGEKGAEKATTQEEQEMAAGKSAQQGGQDRTRTNDKAVQCTSNEPLVMLQDWKEMPRYLQFNPYVLTGYRPLQNIQECFGSLFYFHNETFNILTHGIPIVYILATVPSKLMWDDYRFLSWCHILGSVAPWCGSFLYHLFMNVNRGETVYYTLLKLDMLGIWISQSFGALPMVTATVHCLNWPFKWFFIIMYSLLSIWGLYKAMCATSPWQRRLCFFLPFTMRVLLTMIRFTRFGGGNTTSMTHIFLQDAVSVAGGAIGAMHIPEKWFPGCMDYYLNSHNIMHVLVVLAVYSMHQATVQDLDWMSKAECLVGTTISLQEASSNSDL